MTSLDQDEVMEWVERQLLFTSQFSVEEIFCGPDTPREVRTQHLKRLLLGLPAPELTEIEERFMALGANRKDEPS